MLLSLKLNFLQHNKRLKDLKIGGLVVESGDEDGDPKDIGINLMNMADIGNAAFLDELLKARLDPDIGDSNGRTPLHIAASRGHEDCVLVLLKHACNVHLRDIDGNTAQWDAISTSTIPYLGSCIIVLLFPSLPMTSYAWLRKETIKQRCKNY
ncbi:potassium channel AKT2/3-like [Hibiscus syriacus]|uniref:potassium channel AKT2/3-like n=1 Tax=Hibiscus syriacus TaxID=106335 RepID=UPI001923CC18|nr:potassium channel AKT2/3-like [Hibiscus syriacus]